MHGIRTLLATSLLVGLVAAPTPGLAKDTKQLKGVLEKVDVSAQHIVVRETHGRKHELPLALGSDARIVTPSGTGSLGALHVGDHVTVSYGPGPRGEEAKEIQVTKPASSD